MPKGIYKHDPEHTKASLERIQKASKAYSNEIKGYKELSLKRRNNRTYNINEISRAMSGMVQYIKSCVGSDRPATISGLILASGTNKDFYYKAKNGEYDYITIEYIQLNNIADDDILTDDDGLQYIIDSENNKVILSTGSELIEKCLLLIENDLQIRSLTDKNMARTTGAIFNLKAVFNYNDKPETEARTVNNTLIVNASPEQTSKAMKLLMDNK